MVRIAPGRRPAEAASSCPAPATAYRSAFTATHCAATAPNAAATRSHQLRPGGVGGTVRLPGTPRRVRPANRVPRWNGRSLSVSGSRPRPSWSDWSFIPDLANASVVTDPGVSHFLRARPVGTSKTVIIASSATASHSPFERRPWEKGSHPVAAAGADPSPRSRSPATPRRSYVSRNALSGPSFGSRPTVRS